ncbi:MAG: HD domain-containing phosphohydrolase [Candidatus Eremiobacterota bacterium]
MAESRRKLARYRIAVCASAALFAGWASLDPAFGQSPSSAPVWGIAFLAGLTVAAELWVLQMPRYGAVTLSDSVFYASMLLYSPQVTVALVLISKLVRFVRERMQRKLRPGFVFYSVSQSLLSFGLAARAHSLAAGPGWARQALALVLAVLVGFAVQSLLVALHQWLYQRGMGRWTNRINFQRLRLSLLTMAPLGLLLAICLTLHPAAVLLLLGPLAITCQSVKRYTDTLREARDVIENLAEAVEKRDPHTTGHSARVAAIAEDVARVMGLNEKLVARVATAGRLHDLGKISVGDDILLKIDELTGEELEAIRRYPEVGADVAAKLSLSREEAEFIRHHHEWYDGSGHPCGLKGGAIPLGARILAVAEAFDSMTTPRSYRAALTEEEAWIRLEAGKGIQFDPNVVNAFYVVWQQSRRYSAGLRLVASA